MDHDIQNYYFKLLDFHIFFEKVLLEFCSNSPQAFNTNKQKAFCFIVTNVCLYSDLKSICYYIYEECREASLTKFMCLFANETSSHTLYNYVFILLLALSYHKIVLAGTLYIPLGIYCNIYDCKWWNIEFSQPLRMKIFISILRIYEFNLYVKCLSLSNQSVLLLLFNF